MSAGTDAFYQLQTITVVILLLIFYGGTFWMSMRIREKKKTSTAT